MKLNFKHITCVTIFSISVVITPAQSTKWMTISRPEMAKVLEKMNAWFKITAAYSVTITHASYENYTTTTAVERSVGYFKKD